MWRSLVLFAVLLACQTASAQSPPQAGSFRIPQGTARSQVQSYIAMASKTYGLDPFLVQAVMEVESGWDVMAVSPKGARGLMQIMPKTGDGLGLDQPFDPKANIAAGSLYLKQQLKTFGDAQLALAAYNAGPQSVRKFGGIPPYPETQRYVAAVVSRFLKLKTGRSLEQFVKQVQEGDAPKSRAYPQQPGAEKAPRPKDRHDRSHPER
ncbi:lytic transglycosylase domain-containing protein [Fundidesulfovibrio butyratiphilus]